MSLEEFDHSLKLPHDGVWTTSHASFNAQDFWNKITCDTRIIVKDLLGRYDVYDFSGFKVTSVCNLIL